MQEVPFKEEKPSWFFRRTIIFVTLVFCAAMLAYLTLKAPSDALREQLALGFIGLAATVITGYVFGAVWDDSNWMKSVKSQGQGNTYAGLGYGNSYSAYGAANRPLSTASLHDGKGSDMTEG